MACRVEVLGIGKNEDWPVFVTTSTRQACRVEAEAKHFMPDINVLARLHLTASPRKSSLFAPLKRRLKAAGVEPALLPIFLNDFNRIILGWTTYVQLFMINHLKMSVSRDKILKQIIPPINRYLSMKIPSQMIKFWKLSPSRADTFFEPMSIPLKCSRHVAIRTGALYYRYQMDARNGNSFTALIWG
jgi:hypothetical protein